MSNLFKQGFPGITNVNSEPFVLDVNSRVISNESKTKIIRPVEEKEEQDESDIKEDNVAYKVVLDDAMDTAKSIRDDAIIQAAKIISDANIEAEAIRENARQEGFNKGMEEGSMEAMKKADVYLENLKKEQNELVIQNNIAIENSINDTEKKLIDLTCALVEKLTGINVANYKSVMLHMINNALNEVETSKKFVIRVSEDNYNYVYDNHDRISGATNPNIDIEIYADVNLDRQQCIIESENGIIDLSMDVQIRNLITAIKLLSE